MLSKDSFFAYASKFGQLCICFALIVKSYFSLGGGNLVLEVGVFTKYRYFQLRHNSNFVNHFTKLISKRYRHLVK